MVKKGDLDVFKLTLDDIKIPALRIPVIGPASIIEKVYLYRLPDFCHGELLILSNWKPAYYFIAHSKKHDGIIDFAESRNLQLERVLILLLRENGFKVSNSVPIYFFKLGWKAKAQNFNVKEITISS